MAQRQQKLLEQQQQQQQEEEQHQLSGRWSEWLDHSLQQLRSRNLERILRPLLPTASPVQALIHEAELQAWLDSQLSPDSCTGLALSPQQVSPTLRQQELKLLTLFSLNDYMGLSTHPAVKAAAAAAALQVGNGPRSSALVGGFTTEHRQLELELAALKGTQDALLFPTGYAANVAVVSVLASLGPQQQQQQQQQQSSLPQVMIFSDELNHASIIDGARLAVRGSSTTVQVVVYRHNDLAHLEQLLAAAPEAARKLVVTDSLFSMDGDFADLQGLAALKRRYNFLLVVDEAHATLVCGSTGAGAAEMLGVAAAVDVHVGTLSKAAGALGGFAACSSSLRQVLLNRGRSVVFSTALPVPVVAAARAALRVSQSERWRRRHLWSLTQLFSEALGVPAASPIIPLVVGSEAAALALSRQLLQQGYHVPAIRPPTVPAGTSRLRVSLSAGHTRQQVEQLAAAIKEGLRQLPGGSRLQVLQHLEEPRQVEILTQRGESWCDSGSSGSGSSAGGSGGSSSSGGSSGQQQQQQQQHSRL